MTKADLINAVAKTTKLSKRAAGDAVDATFGNLAGRINGLKSQALAPLRSGHVRQEREEIPRPGM